jgi:hypothetical protein
MLTAPKEKEEALSKKSWNMLKQPSNFWPQQTETLKWEHFTDLRIR